LRFQKVEHQKLTDARELHEEQIHETSSREGKKNSRGKIRKAKLKIKQTAKLTSKDLVNT